MSQLSAVVTLDTSALAQEALAVAPFLKQAGLKRVHLVAVSEDHDHRTAAERVTEAAPVKRLKDYLAGVAERRELEGLIVDVSVREGRPAEEILTVVNEVSPDLVVIATHGRTGFEHWQLGSVADKVIRSVSCPTLVIGPNVDSKALASFAVNRILVPLDGSDVAEKALVVADWLATATGAELELVEVVRLPNTWAADPMYVPDPSLILDDLEAGAKNYLSRQLPGHRANRTVIRTFAGGVGPEVLSLVRQEKVDLVVLTSHTRHGLSRAVLGSVADELLRGSAPVLVIRGSEPVPANLAARPARALNPVG